MKVLICSDTHGKQDLMKQVIEREKPFEVLVHAGDMEDQVICVLGYTDYQVRIVAGNCDYGLGYSREQFFDLGKFHTLLLHGNICGGMSCNPAHDLNPLCEYAKRKGADILIYGHTHVPKVVKRNHLLVINPGSLSLPRQENHEPSYAVLNIEGDDISCEIRYPLMKQE